MSIFKGNSFHSEKFCTRFFNSRFLSILSVNFDMSKFMDKKQLIFIKIVAMIHAFSACTYLLLVLNISIINQYINKVRNYILYWSVTTQCCCRKIPISVLLDQYIITTCMQNGIDCSWCKCLADHLGTFHRSPVISNWLPSTYRVNAMFPVHKGLMQCSQYVKG